MKPLIDGPIARDPKMGRIEIRRRSRAIDDPWGCPMRTARNLLSATYANTRFRA